MWHCCVVLTPCRHVIVSILDLMPRSKHVSFSCSSPIFFVPTIRSFLWNIIYLFQIRSFFNVLMIQPKLNLFTWIMLKDTYDPPSSPSPHTLHLCQRAPSCGNTVRLALLLTGCRSQSSAQFLRGDQEPWAFRGGLAGEFQVSNALNLQQSNGKKKECCEQRRQW